MLERPTNVTKGVPQKSWCTKVELCGSWTCWVWHCGTTKLDCLVGCFVKNWNSWFLRC